MADSASSDSPDPFSSAAAFDEGASADDPRDEPPWEAADGDSLDDLSPSFAADMARIWVKRHQKASMLGAFAVGVFVGALLRK